ncbi:plastocyanin [Labrenzia sp. EL_208]|nr:plastocyanin [Labrenzia sp. EL_132]MBG6233223.1 plastocyanin [Labrenzia sp. EL_208]
MPGLTRREFGVLVCAALTTSARASDGPQIIIKRFKFDPPELAIIPGTVVMWTNLDAAPHTATDQSEEWDTGELKKGETGSIVFETEGSFEYFCRFHPNMRAKIVVRELNLRS